MLASSGARLGSLSGGSLESQVDPFRRPAGYVIPHLLVGALTCINAVSRRSRAKSGGVPLGVAVHRPRRAYSGQMQEPSTVDTRSPPCCATVCFSGPGAKGPGLRDLALQTATALCDTATGPLLQLLLQDEVAPRLLPSTDAAVYRTPRSRSGSDGLKKIESAFQWQWDLPSRYLLILALACGDALVASVVQRPVLPA